MEYLPLDILLVEDEDAHAEAIRRSFLYAQPPCNIRTVGTLHGFHEAVNQKTPDIAILDLNLPDGNAMEVLTYPPEDNAFPVLIMTSYGTEKIAVEAMRSGALDYVIKSPDTFADMPHIVDRALSQWQLIHAHRRTENELDRYKNHLEDLVEIRTAEVMRKTALLQAINKVLIEAITCETEDELWDTFLHVALDLSNSKIGQIGEINVNGMLDIKAISAPDVTLGILPLEKGTDNIKDIPLRDIDREVLIDGKSRILGGEPSSELPADLIPLTKDHPEFTAFLGVPLKRGDTIIGMIRLGNKPNGYTEEDIENIEALSVSMVQVLRFKRAEATIKKLNASLSQRTKQLEYSNSELKSFSSTVSHDLRAPLRGISKFSHSLKQMPIEEDGIMLVDRIISETNRMTELIDSLLELARVSRSQLHRIEFSMTDLVTDIVAMLRHAEPDRAIDVQIAANVMAKGDPLLIRQALENLLGNSFKFTGKTENPVIEFTMKLQERIPVYTIRDNGAGFDMEYADKVFQPFQRLHSSDEFPGTGIGLSTVERIVRRHGGKVWCESVIDKGTAFHFTLNSEE